MNNAQKYRLTSDRGETVLVGQFDTYVEEGVDRVAGWFGLPSETSVGYIDLILDVGPIVQLQAVDGHAAGWNMVPVAEDETARRRDAIRVVLRNHGLLVAVRDEWADELIRQLAEAAK